MQEPRWHYFEQNNTISVFPLQLTTAAGKAPTSHRRHQRRHAKRFRHISTWNSQVTALTCDLEIIRKICIFLSSILPSLSPWFSLNLPSSPQSNRFHLPLLLLFAGLNWWYWLFLGWGEQSAGLASVPGGWLDASSPASLQQPQSDCWVYLWPSHQPMLSVARTSGHNRAKDVKKRGDEWPINGKTKNFLSVQTW